MKKPALSRNVRLAPSRQEGSRLHRITFCRPCGAPVPHGALVCHACGARAALHPWMECGQIRLS